MSKKETILHFLEDTVKAWKQKSKKIYKSATNQKTVALFFWTKEEIFCIINTKETNVHTK